MATANLSNPPTLLRSNVARGIAAGEKAIERDGGDKQAGVIRGFSVITRGEAAGHEMWIDATMVSQVSKAITKAKAGIKSRFTHPNLSGDGLGKHLGRVKSATDDGETVRADLHFDTSAHSTPDGDLASYAMELAHSDPAAFGTSIAFKRDLEAERKFLIDNGGKPGGGYYQAMEGFRSPDPDNKHNWPHARLSQLRAVDVVDDPAANPNGLFHQGTEVIEEAEALADFALGFTTDAPELVELDLDPSRVTGFVRRFLDSRGLQIAPKTGVQPMPDDIKPIIDPQLSEPPKPPQPEPEPEPEPEPQAAAGPGQAFLDAFGEKGAVWFAQGKTFEQARDLFAKEQAKQLGELAEANKQLAADKAELQKQLAAARGEQTPVSFSTADDDPQAKRFKKHRNNLGDNLAKVAAGMKFADRN